MASQRLERLLNLIIALLNTSRPMTAREIRQRVAGYGASGEEAFRRMFERDKQALRELGIPLEVAKADPLDEHSDGYWIPRDRYYLPDLGLTPDELAALRLAVQAASAERSLAESAYLKIAAQALGAAEDEPVVAWGGDLSEVAPVLARLYEARLERRVVRFDYAPPGREPARRTVEPYQLVNRRGLWYLVGRDVDRGEPRSFRVSRISGEIEVTGRRFDPPEGFDADSVLPPEAFAIGAQRIRTVVRFAPELRWWAEQNMTEAPSAEGPEGSLELELSVGNLEQLVSWCLGFAERVEILSPPEARAAMRAHLEEVRGALGG